MDAIFLDLVNISITASWIVLAVVLIRLILKKAPKWISCVLWGIVGLRLIMPFRLESIFSLIPSTKTIDTTTYQARPNIQTGITMVDDPVNNYIGSHYFEGVTAPTDHFSNIVSVIAVIWIIGMLLLMGYSIISYIRLRQKVAASIVGHDNIYYCDDIDSPFLLGLFKPRIYLPSGMPDDQTRYVIEHEKAHLKRKDHWWKPIGFLLLSVYWFNPVMWIAYILLCRDIELACDEKAVRNFDCSDRKGYSQALVDCSVRRRMIMACPLAFGEVSVKNRIRSVLNYKKPAFWVIVLSVIVCLAVAVAFLTDPKKPENETPETGSELEGLSIEIVSCDFSGDSPSITVKWHNNTKNEITYGEEFHIYQRNGDGWKDCQENDNIIWHSIAYTVSPMSSSEKQYPLSTFTMTQPGRYRFESKCLLQGNSYAVWAEFELDTGLQRSNSNSVGIQRLKNKYPEYFDLDATNGLTVYIWQMGIESYSCVLVSGRPLLLDEEIFWLPYTTIYEMKAIVQSYNIPEDQVYITSTVNPLSSYWYEINDSYIESLRELFWSADPSILYAEYEPVYDTAAFDIDGDGAIEQCSMSVGPTSGLFSVKFNVQENGETEYRNTVVFAKPCDLTFEEDENGTVRVRAETGENVYYLDIAIKDGYVTLSEENGDHIIMG